MKTTWLFPWDCRHLSIMMVMNIYVSFIFHCYGSVSYLKMWNQWLPPSLQPTPWTSALPNSVGWVVSISCLFVITLFSQDAFSLPIWKSLSGNLPLEGSLKTKKCLFFITFPALSLGCNFSELFTIPFCRRLKILCLVFKVQHTIYFQSLFLIDPETLLLGIC